MRYVSLFLVVLLVCSCSDESQDKYDSYSDVDLPEITKGMTINAGELYDESKLIATLRFIESFHRENKTGLSLNEPATEKEIEMAQSVFGCIIPNELKALWQWHNGEKSQKFIWYHRFLSIDESIAEYEDLVATDYLMWSKNWIPVFEYQEEWYGVRCIQETTKASPVIFYFIEAGVAIPYTNLSRYLEVMAASMKDGGLRWVDGWWDVNLKLVSKNHSNLNQSFIFPYHVGQ